MDWLVKIIKRLFCRRKIRLIEEPETTSCKVEKNREDFLIILRQNSDLECDDRNGYKIIKNSKLKDMI